MNRSNFKTESEGAKLNSVQSNYQQQLIVGDMECVCVCLCVAHFFRHVDRKNVILFKSRPSSHSITGSRIG